MIISVTDSISKIIFNGVMIEPTKLPVWLFGGPTYLLPKNIDTGNPRNY